MRPSLPLSPLLSVELTSLQLKSIAAIQPRQQQQETWKPRGRKDKKQEHQDDTTDPSFILSSLIKPSRRRKSLPRQLHHVYCI
ncbi:hypothetical protein K505DRAFT_329375 [Melanomma pulvis-pyrius CBS 109.77]|uniref:Uncharacterized protein n=1 Tax=Melanomma pulvis-pyrius CBS 109.77 TaxID=1314802 RepID=A0A6A6WVC9_9PLEO|nr:hypothetical protein K505DRAFT_329375 [Melanomma pulvis-pyrius CBS 109.77]